MKKKQMDYQNGYIAEKYDRINVTIPKGLKEHYRQYAASQGLSLNAAINQLLKDWAPAPAEADTLSEGKPTRATRIETLDFISETSVKALKEMGIYTLGEYIERYYDDDPDELLTVIEEDKLDDLLLNNKLW